jgi:hypothetical protein
MLGEQKQKEGTGVFRPHSRLWEPDPMIEAVLLPLLLQQVEQHTSPTRFEIVDVGAGAGRDVAFLAAHLKAKALNVCVVGVDQRYRSDDQCKDFWKREDVHDVTDSFTLDLDNVDSFIDAINEREKSMKCTVKCIYAVRYWNRSLVEALTKRESLTVFAISQFGKSHPGAKWEFAHPKEKHVVDRYELRDIFQTSSLPWKILHDEVVLDSDHGRSLVQFVATKSSLG